MDDGTPRPGRQSLRALDALNVFLADVRDGLGPYLAIYLTTRHWDPSRIGVAMSAMGVAAVIAQTPAGALIDRTTRKRSWIIAAAALVAMGAVAMVRAPTFPVILAAQATVGAFNHAGNVAAAILAGLIGDHIAYEGIFYLIAAMSAGSIASALLIRRDEVDDELARGGDHDPGSDAPRAVAIGELFRDRRVATFAASIVLFHFANAAMLPLVGQKMTVGMTGGVAGYMSACIIAAQLVMIPVALAASRLADRWGRRPTFLIGFAVLPVRGALYTLTDDPRWLVAIQLLDGIGAGIFGVVGVLVVADLTRGTGRFNLMQGALATATGLGASASQLLTGVIVSRSGFDAGFLALSAIAAAALAFFGLAMPETRPEGEGPAGRAT